MYVTKHFSRVRLRRFPAGRRDEGRSRLMIQASFQPYARVSAAQASCSGFTAMNGGSAWWIERKTLGAWFPGIAHTSPDQLDGAALERVGWLLSGRHTLPLMGQPRAPARQRLEERRYRREDQALCALNLVPNRILLVSRTRSKIVGPSGSKHSLRHSPNVLAILQRRGSKGEALDRFAHRKPPDIAV